MFIRQLTRAALGSSRKEKDEARVQVGNGDESTATPSEHSAPSEHDEGWEHAAEGADSPSEQEGRAGAGKVSRSRSCPRLPEKSHMPEASR